MEDQKTTEEKKDIATQKTASVADAEKKTEESSSDTQKKEKSTKHAKKGNRQVYKGQAHVQCTYNNTIVTITDLSGNVLGWSSAGSLGFKGAKKSTPYAASQVVSTVNEKVQKNGIKELEVYVKGVGSGREASVRALAGHGFDLTLIKDITPIAHNGCRPRRPRRV